VVFTNYYLNKYYNNNNNNNININSVCGKKRLESRTGAGSVYQICKYISKELDNFNSINFKPIVIQVDDSEDFSSQDLESSLSISTQLVEISDEEMEDEMDPSSQKEKVLLPPDYTFSFGLKLSSL
jgi:hypothetical protein